MNLKGKLSFAGLSHAGKVRPHNEDAIGIEPELGLVVLADGMGGYKAGEVASALAVETITDYVRKEIGRAMRKPPAAKAPGPLVELLKAAVEHANGVIHKMASSQSRYEGMGTTVVACLYHDNRVSIAHVGDSRVYRLRRDIFEQVTRDHSLLQELVARGFYTAEEARKSLNKNLVTRALGVQPDVEVELKADVVLPGDVHLLCSDGLSDMVDDADLHLTLTTFSANLDTAAQQMVQMANDNGGRDNISVVLAQARRPFPYEGGLVARLKAMFS